MENRACSNCGSETTENFCANCGQRQLGRLTMAFVFQNSMGYLLNFDNSFLKTFWQLVVRPKEVIRDFIEGRRASHFPPFKMLVFTTSIVALVFVYIPNADPANFDITVNDDQIGLKVKEMINRYFSVIYFLSIPFGAIGNRIFFRKKGYNFAEHLLVVTYITCGVNFFNLLAYLGQATGDGSVVAISSGVFGLISFIYQFRTTMLVFDEMRFVGFLKALGSLVLASIGYLTLLIILGASYYLLFLK